MPDVTAELEQEFNDFDSVLERRSTIYRRWTHGQHISISLFHVLSRLAHRGEQGASPSELADDFLIPRQTMTGIVDSLVGDGLVTVDSDPRDRRRKILHLSDAGAAYITEHFAAIHEHELAAYLSLSERERAQFNKLVRKYVSALDTALDDENAPA